MVSKSIARNCFGFNTLMDSLAQFCSVNTFIIKQILQIWPKVKAKYCYLIQSWGRIQVSNNKYTFQTREQSAKCDKLWKFSYTLKGCLCISVWDSNLWHNSWPECVYLVEMVSKSMHLLLECDPYVALKVKTLTKVKQCYEKSLLHKHYSQHILTI